jgi:uncharacterized membrane protein
MSEEKKATSGGDNDKLMGILAYLGILVLVPLLAAKDSKFAQYHARQGLTLFVVEIVLTVLYWIVGFAAVFTGGFGFILFPLLGLVWLGTLVLSIIGIVNVINNEEKPLPVIGGIQLMK